MADFFNILVSQKTTDNCELKIRLIEGGDQSIDFSCGFASMLINEDFQSDYIINRYYKGSLSKSEFLNKVEDTALDAKFGVMSVQLIETNNLKKINQFDPDKDRVEVESVEIDTTDYWLDSENYPEYRIKINVNHAAFIEHLQVGMQLTSRAYCDEGRSNEYWIQSKELRSYLSKNENIKFGNESCIHENKKIKLLDEKFDKKVEKAYLKILREEENENIKNGFTNSLRKILEKHCSEIENFVKSYLIIDLNQNRAAIHVITKGGEKNGVLIKTDNMTIREILNGYSKCNKKTIMLVIQLIDGIDTSSSIEIDSKDDYNYQGMTERGEGFWINLDN